MSITPIPHPLPVLAIHGGAGTLTRGTMSADQEALYRDALSRILMAGQEQLAAGASAVDVVVEAVRLLEECELFNAGKGAVYTSAGTHELDACVMDGRDCRAGAVAGVSRTRNPILAARAVMDHSAHLLFVGAAADDLAARHGLEQVAPTWFGTPHRLEQLRRAQRLQAGALRDHDGQDLLRQTTPSEASGPIDEETKFGTVGAVALDAAGHLAAATSTGGMTNKQIGRVGDTPLVGAGTYANDATVAVSCTGTGELFIRACAAHDVSALMAYAGMSLEEACDRVVMQKLPADAGGLIAVAANGDVCLPFNSEGMYRGYARAGAARPVVAVYRSE
ncbi:isoaspartyl peptidase/L-asparaginase family protein [Paucibacter sp. DJ2R-2]|uniref:isoaspartyl peptidase/L-asparaginase family protein n=1 Tax=Paucibacter sp. DJ2R-2 TaxID=2893558 RepID=UPI0021E39793|nr:isoaspartyl peptidase/L-asparaginase [Paucibacter sp. DJ2R-2]MCV2420728.1 isoaspartyl peptidase/L-asparaginase [Paucibacter sp. DJ4R-1]MCV2439927.1 isoaspartyl peptidase/L-asparaginase [Paucibacter sp. DJ2R-2]